MVSAALDVTANLLLAKSRGFTRRLPGVSALCLVGLAFFCLFLAVRTLPLTVAYAMWGAMGILGTSLGGWLLFRQRLRARAFAGMGLLIFGMVFLRVSN